MYCSLIKIEIENGDISNVKILESKMKIQDRKMDYENKIKMLLAEDYGRKTFINFYEIDNIKLIKEPTFDGIYVYRTDNIFHVYEKISKEISGYIYGKKIVSHFRQTTQYHFIYSEFAQKSEIIKKESVKEVIENYIPNKNSFLRELEQSPKFLQYRQQL